MALLSGDGSLTRWLEDPTEPNTTLSWNVIHGKTQKKNCVYVNPILMLLCFFIGIGMITHDILSSPSYYVALGNLDEDVEVFL